MNALFETSEILGHPFVVGELAVGHLRNRALFLQTLEDLPQATVARHDEVRSLIETHSLFGLGLGYVDVHLMASARLSGARLWTLDRRLAEAGQRLGVT